MMLTAMSKDSHLFTAFFLALIAALATSILLSVYKISEPIIQLRQQEDQLRGLNAVLPAAYVNSALLNDQYRVTFEKQTYQVFPARDSNGKTLAYAVQSNAVGFSGDITLLVGTNAQFDITGVRVLSHSETPGLGDKIEAAKSDWVQRFIGQSLTALSPAQWHVKKDGGVFDQFTGATITPRAVVQQVHQTLYMLKTTQKEAEK